MARLQRRLAALAAALVLVPAGRAAAQEEPTEVTALSAERTDGSLRVSGTAAFGEQDEVGVTVPLGLEVAPEFTPGAVIRTDDGMTASIQAAASNSATSDTVIQGPDYPIPYLYTGDINRGFDVFKWTGGGPAPREEA